ncbi:unnamed protein product, partial [Brachionus calyciflorus]
MIEKDVNSMHYTASLVSFIQIRDEALARWSLYPELSSFRNYFTTQWLEGIWVNWPLFTRPAGFCTT